jgi:flagellar motor switch protein FliN/FliY
MSEEQDDLADAWEAALDEQANPKPVKLEQIIDSPSPLNEDERRRLDTILDIPVTISMEVGRSRISIRNLLQLNQGSVVELDRVAGEPLDVMVNGTLIAHGEVVVVNDKFGIRLTDVISQTERIKKLR